MPKRSDIKYFWGGNLLASDSNGFRVLKSGKFKVESGKLVPKAAFTLAEVLITLGIIGVVAAITMPPLITNVTEKVNSERQTNIAQKITQAMEQMRAHGLLNSKYATTEAFVDELQKYIKIAKRCDFEHVAECWPTDKVTDSQGNEFEVSKAKTGKNLSLTTTTNNVGLVLADGAALILNYNPEARTLDVGDRVEPRNNYTTEVTDAIDFVMDVNGGKGPNSEVNSKNRDIRSFKSASFSKGGPDCSKYANSIEIEGIGCVVNLGTSYSCISEAPYTNNNNCWAGAKQACSSQGMSLPDKDTLKSIYDSHTSGLPTSGWFWSSSESDTSYVWRLYFINGYQNDSYKSDRDGVLCVGN